jgi:hypothetical protein
LTAIGASKFSTLFAKTLNSQSSSEPGEGSWKLIRRIARAWALVQFPSTPPRQPAMISKEQHGGLPTAGQSISPATAGQFGTASGLWRRAQGHKAGDKVIVTGYDLDIPSVVAVSRYDKAAPLGCISGLANKGSFQGSMQAAYYGGRSNSPSDS